MRGTRWTMLALVAISTVVLAAIAGLVVTKNGEATPDQDIKVAVVTDIGGVNDKGFNSLANAGLNRAKKQLNVDGRLYITQTAADRQPNLTAAAQDGYDLVIGVGFLMYDPLSKVPLVFKNTKFAGVDVPYGFVKDTAKADIPNLRGLLFKEAEAGYLVGYIAGLQVKRQAGPDIISALGANEVPAIVAFIAGYKAGAKRANSKVRVLVNYANDPTFQDQAKCRATALSQIARGSKIVFTAAGQCGLGGLDAARRRGVWGIGVDADQFFLGKHMLTSATKKVDVSVYETIAAYKRNPSGFRGGIDVIYSSKNNGVGYGRLSTRLPAAVRREYTRKANVIQRLIARGTINPPVK